MGALFVIVLAIVVLAVVGAAVFGLALKLLWWAIIGLFLGGLGRLIVPGRQPIGLLATALIGIAGSLLGGDIARAAHLSGLLQFVLAVLVAAGLVIIYSRWQAARTH